MQNKQFTEAQKLAQDIVTSRLQGLFNIEHSNDESITEYTLWTLTPKDELINASIPKGTDVHPKVLKNFEDSVIRVESKKLMKIGLDELTNLMFKCDDKKEIIFQEFDVVLSEDNVIAELDEFLKFIPSDIKSKEGFKVLVNNELSDMYNSACNRFLDVNSPRLPIFVFDVLEGCGRIIAGVFTENENSGFSIMTNVFDGSEGIAWVEENRELDSYGNFADFLGLKGSFRVDFKINNSKEMAFFDYTPPKSK